MALPVLTLRVRIFLFFMLLMLAAPVVIGMAIWLAYQSDAPDPSRLLATYAGLGSVLLLFVTVFVWQLFDRHVATALQSLARQMQTALHSNTPGLLDSESLRYLGPVSAAATEITTALHELREKSTSGQLSDASTLEARQMAAILRDLDTGVLVMNLEHRVLLYNQRAMSMLSPSESVSVEQHIPPPSDAIHSQKTPKNPFETKAGLASGTLPGLARPVMDLFKGNTLRHAAERLLASREQDGPAIPLILSSRHMNRLLQGTVGLVKDANGKSNGYVLVFDDATPRLSLANHREQLTQFALLGAQSSVNDLMATTHARDADDSVLTLVGQLQQHLNEVDSRYNSIQNSEWPMADYLSADLLDSAVAAYRDTDQQQNARVVTVRMHGESVWLLGNTYLLDALLTELLRHVAALSSAPELSLVTKALSGTSQLEISWCGNPLTQPELDELLDAQLPDNPTGICGRQVLNHHDTGIKLLHDDNTWSLQLNLGACSSSIAPPTALKENSVQINAAESNKSSDEVALPSRPDFYDFDLFSRVVDADVQNRSLKEIDYVVFDTETTGLNPSGGDEIVSIAAVRIVNGRVLHSERFNKLINPGRPVPKRSIVFHGITDEMLQGKPPIVEVLPSFAQFVGDSVLVAHNAAFDMKFISLKEDECDVKFTNPVLDTVLLSAWLHDHSHKHTLDDLAKRFGITIKERHSALGDSQATAEIFIRLVAQLATREVHTLSQALQVSSKMTHIKRQQKAY